MKILFWCLLLLGLSGCIEVPNTYTQLPPGQWRGILKLTEPGQEQDISVHNEDQKVSDYFALPFNMEVSYEGDKMQVFLINGDEKIQIEDAYIGRDLGTAKDTLRLNMTAYDTYMDGFYEENFIEGYWIVNYKENYRIPYIITYGQQHRFISKPVKNTKDFSGKWKVVFDYDGDPYEAIGEFKQDGNDLSGTFLTETGDFRYLDGNAFGDKMRLSVFDGSHAFLFSGSMDQDTIYGEFRSGKHYKTNWYGVKDESFSLKDPNQMTKSDHSKAIDFSFPDTKGNTVKLTDTAYEGKVKLVSIMGTWCPNCKDETAYLKTLKQNPKYKDVEIISIAFERYRDQSKALAVLDNYKEIMSFDWPLLLGGYADKKETGETFDFLDKIYSYPTLLFIDGDNKVQHIHTGFSGPATSKYESTKKDLENKLTELLSQ